MPHVAPTKQPATHRARNIQSNLDELMDRLENKSLRRPLADRNSMPPPSFHVWDSVRNVHMGSTPSLTTSETHSFPVGVQNVQAAIQGGFQQSAPVSTTGSSVEALVKALDNLKRVASNTNMSRPATSQAIVLKQPVSQPHTRSLHSSSGLLVGAPPASAGSSLTAPAKAGTVSAHHAQRPFTLSTGTQTAPPSRTCTTGTQTDLALPEILQADRQQRAQDSEDPSHSSAPVASKGCKLCPDSQGGTGSSSNISADTVQQLVQDQVAAALKSLLSEPPQWMVSHITHSQQPTQPQEQQQQPVTSLWMPSPLTAAVSTALGMPSMPIACGHQIVPAKPSQHVQLVPPLLASAAASVAGQDHYQEGKLPTPPTQPPSTMNWSPACPSQLVIPSQQQPPQPTNTPASQPSALHMAQMLPPTSLSTSVPMQMPAHPLPQPQGLLQSAASPQLNTVSVISDGGGLPPLPPLLASRLEQHLRRKSRTESLPGHSAARTPRGLSTSGSRATSEHRPTNKVG